jgi:hypothetical protein
MAKKLLPNRSSKKLPVDASTKLAQAVQLVLDLLGERSVITEEDYNALRKISDKLKQECDDVFAIAQANPEFVEPPLQLSEMEKDKNFYEFCDKIELAFSPVQIFKNREQNISGGEYLNGCNFFESTVAFRAAQGNPKAQMIAIQLKQLKRNRGGNPNKPTQK